MEEYGDIEVSVGSIPYERDFRTTAADTQNLNLNHIREEDDAVEIQPPLPLPSTTREDSIPFTLSMGPSMSPEVSVAKAEESSPSSKVGES